MEISEVGEALLNPNFSSLLEYLVNPSDRSVKPIIGNPDIEKLEEFEYSTSVDDFTLLSNNDLATLAKEDLEEFLTKIYKSAVANTTMKEKLNLMNYLVYFVQGSNNANLIVESLFMDLFVKWLKTVKTKSFKVLGS